jgi:uncharacterized membrane protein YraQ (UPF0718 family)
MLAFTAAAIFSIWMVCVESSGWLLFGFAIAVCVHRFLPQKLISTHLRRPGLGSIVKASAFGLPLPLCSCSVIPVAVALRRRGASAGATAGFFVSTPEIGIDSFLLSYGLLGAPLAWLRTAAAFCAAVAAGLLIEWTSSAAEEETLSISPAGESAPAPRCGCDAACCASEAESENVQSRTWQAALRFVFVEMMDDIAPSLLVGFVLAGLTAVFLPEDFFPSLGLNSFELMLLMLLVSAPLYVCASSTTPLAAALLSRGLPPGAVIVFLLAGPATNVPMMLVMRREFGNQGLAAYLGGVIGVTLAFGVLLSQMSFSMPDAGILAAAHLHEPVSLTAGLAAVLMLLLLLVSGLRRIRRAGGGVRCGCMREGAS